MWRLENATDEETAHEIGHRIGQMTGELVDPAEVWDQASARLTVAQLAVALHHGFELGLANLAITYYQSDRPAIPYNKS